MVVRFILAVSLGICAIDVVSDHDPSAFVRWTASFTLLVAAAGACGLLDRKPISATPSVEVICPTCGRDILDPTTRLECDHPLSASEVVRVRGRSTHGRKPEQTRTGWSA